MVQTELEHPLKKYTTILFQLNICAAYFALCHFRLLPETLWTITESFPNYHRNELGQLPVREIHLDPEFREAGSDRKFTAYIHDAALLRIDLPEGIEPTALSCDRVTDEAIEKQQYANSIAAAYGSDGTGGVGTLKETVLPALSSSACQNDTVLLKLKENILCVGILDNGRKGFYIGDSGGPYLTNDTSGTKELIGIVSSGDAGVRFINDKNDTQRETYTVTYLTRMDLIKDFIIQSIGIDGSQLFVWSNEIAGAARVTSDSDVGICRTKEANELLCTLDIKNRLCICPDLECGFHKYSDTDYFDILQGNISLLYQWLSQTQEIPENALFNSRTIDNEPESGNNFASQPATPEISGIRAACRVQFAAYHSTTIKLVKSTSPALVENSTNYNVISSMTTTASVEAESGSKSDQSTFFTNKATPPLAQLPGKKNIS